MKLLRQAMYGDLPAEDLRKLALEVFLQSVNNISWKTDLPLTDVDMMQMAL